MGSAMSAVINTFASKPEQEKIANDALNSLVAIAGNRQTTFYEHITSPNFDPKTIPINKVIYKYQFFRCGVAKDAGAAIVNEIESSLSEFINGDTAKGLAKIATTCLDALFGTFTANQSQKTIYAISTGGLGGVARIDADFYAYEYTSQTLSQVTKNVVVVSIVISTAKIDDLEFNDVSTIVETVYSASTEEEQKKIRDSIWEAVEKGEKGGKKKGTLGGGNSDTAENPNVLDRLDEEVFKRLNGGVHSEVPEIF